MRPILGGAGAALLLASLPVAAQDARLVDVPYQEREVVKIDSKLGIQATVAFEDGELIENVAVGDAENWQITPNKRADLLFVKPLEATARTNMTVVTNRRTYFFDLVATPKSDPVYMLSFTYGQVPGVASAEATPEFSEAFEQMGAPATGMAKIESLRQELLAGAATENVAPPASAGPVEGASADQAVDPAMLNFAWREGGSRRLIPARVYDDGTSTYLLWGEGQDVPSILLEGADGTEQPAEYSLRGNTIVLAQVPERILLRNGSSRASLENLREPASDANDGSATAASSDNVPGAAVADSRTANTTRGLQPEEN